jgi:hypothetical protein
MLKLLHLAPINLRQVRMQAHGRGRRGEALLDIDPAGLELIESLLQARGAQTGARLRCARWTVPS